MYLRRLFLTAALAAGLLAACSGGAQTTPPTAVPQSTPTAVPVAGADALPYTNLTPAQLAERLKAKDFFLVNVHTPYAGEIAATDAFIPYDQTAQLLSQYPSDRQAQIVVYCRSGRMSAIAAAELARAGYTHIWNLEGGMSAWEQAGFSLVQK